MDRERGGIDGERYRRERESDRGRERGREKEREIWRERERARDREREREREMCLLATQRVYSVGIRIQGYELEEELCQTSYVHNVSPSFWIEFLH